ncbi:hypothetical protein MLD38_012510 [Melastoma candidum]|uniref:Uncharacterized protein n=1 Tax=Melastoma candidum TaxID=119954 RepID=A0ACB9REZ6_9MYRT|nr:hypothetical protein MLD38_012510 [Melastoma candidum]
MGPPDDRCCIHSGCLLRPQQWIGMATKVFQLVAHRISTKRGIQDKLLATMPELLEGQSMLKIIALPNGMDGEIDQLDS